MLDVPAALLVVCINFRAVPSMLQTYCCGLDLWVLSHVQSTMVSSRCQGGHFSAKVSKQRVQCTTRLYASTMDEFASLPTRLIGRSRQGM